MVTELYNLYQAGRLVTGFATITTISKILKREYGITDINSYEQNGFETVKIGQYQCARVPRQEKLF